MARAMETKHWPPRTIPPMTDAEVEALKDECLYQGKRPNLRRAKMGWGDVWFGQAMALARQRGEDLPAHPRMPQNGVSNQLIAKLGSHAADIAKARNDSDMRALASALCSLVSLVFEHAALAGVDMRAIGRFGLEEGLNRGRLWSDAFDDGQDSPPTMKPGDGRYGLFQAPVGNEERLLSFKAFLEKEAANGRELWEVIPDSLGGFLAVTYRGSDG